MPLGAVVQPGATTIGRHIRVWGVNEPVPSTASGDWAPRHLILDAYNAAIWSDCRSMAPGRFFKREGKAIAAAVWKTCVYSYYRSCRWVYVYSLRFVAFLACLLIPVIIALIVSRT